MSRSLLLVDDEYMILEGLKRLLPYEEYGISTILTAEDAEEALAILAQHPVDVVLTDVCMPDKTGLEMIAEMKSLSPQTAYIIMSGYQEFDFVKKALSLGAADYLVKPIRKSELSQVLSTVLAHLPQEESLLYRSVLEGTEPLAAALVDGSPLYLLANLEPLEGLSGLEVLRNQQRIYYYLSRHLPEQSLLYQEELGTASELSSCYERVESLLFYGRVPEQLGGTTQAAYELVLPALQAGQIRELTELLPEVMEVLRQAAPAVYLAKQFFIQLMTELYHDFQHLSRQNLEEFLLEVKACQTLDQLGQVAQQHLSTVHKGHQYSNHVMECLQIVREEYQTELTLKEVSERLFLNTVYLGQLIKKETGLTFAALLNRQRIKQAQQLLLTSQQGIEEICFAVGYTNVGYFYKIFKRICGQSPKSYRQNKISPEIQEERI